MLIKFFDEKVIRFILKMQEKNPPIKFKYEKYISLVTFRSISFPFIVRLSMFNVRTHIYIYIYLSCSRIPHPFFVIDINATICQMINGLTRLLHNESGPSPIRLIPKIARFSIYKFYFRNISAVFSHKTTNIFN